jgi:branched-chain amino acid transport system permease protein
LLRDFASYRSVVNGLILVLVILYLPKGIWEPRRIRAWINTFSRRQPKAGGSN